MTFSEWFNKEYPDLGPTIIRLSFHHVAQKAWDKAYASGLRDGVQAQVEFQDFIDGDLP